MKRTLEYKNISEFAGIIYTIYDNGSDVAVIGNYQFIIDTMNELVKTTELELYSVQIDHPAVEHYLDPWVMSIDEEGKIWCEKAVNDGVLVNEWAFAVFVDAGVDKKVIDHYDDASVVIIGENTMKAKEEPKEEPKEDGESEDNGHGIDFSYTFPDGSTWSASIYSNDPDVINRAMKIFKGVKGNE